MSVSVTIAATGHGNPATLAVRDAAKTVRESLPFLGTWGAGGRGTTMTMPRMWEGDEFDRIAAADELRIMPLRQDGTPRNPVTTWVVSNNDNLYVRSYKGADGAWFRAAQERHEGVIRADGVRADVAFAEEDDPAVNDQIDAAYRAKYSRYGSRYVDPMVAPRARATTLRLVPR